MHLSQSSLYKEENSYLGLIVIRFVNHLALICCFRETIREVDALSEHKTGHWGFIRLNSQSFAHVGKKTGLPRTMPQKELVVDFLLEGPVCKLFGGFTH